MSTEKIYPKGLRVFPKHANAPEFVVGSIIVTPNELFAWLKENTALLTEYNGEKQLRLQLLNGNKGLYLVCDTYKAEAKVQQPINKENEDKLPF